MYCVKCAHSMCKWRLRIVGHNDGVCINSIDKKCSGLKSMRDNKHDTCFWIEKKCLRLYDNLVKYAV